MEEKRDPLNGGKAMDESLQFIALRAVVTSGEFGLGKQAADGC